MHCVAGSLKQRATVGKFCLLCCHGQTSFQPDGTDDDLSRHACFVLGQSSDTELVSILSTQSHLTSRSVVLQNEHLPCHTKTKTGQHGHKDLPMVSQLSHQDSKELLQSHVWGCDAWHALNSRCKELLNSLYHSDSVSSADLPLLQERFAESLLDCYVHTRVCSRCTPSQTVATARGKVTDQVRRIGHGAWTPSSSQEDAESSTPASVTSSHRQDPDHSGSARRFGHFGVPAWNIEVARSQRL